MPTWQLPRLAPLASASRASLGIILVAVNAPGVRAEPVPQIAEVQFNADFLQGGGRTVDLARFATASPVLPGSYTVDLTLNEHWIARTAVTFVAIPGSSDAAPCFDEEVLSRIELDVRALPASTRAALAAGRCADLAGTIPGGSVEFDQSALRLAVSLPQAVLRRQARGYVPPRDWQKGVPSVTLAYDTSVFRLESSGTATTSVYAGLIAGVNLGNWHFRERGSLSGVSGKWHYQNLAAYAERALPAIKSILTIGDGFTDGTVFDSFGFRGIALASDDRMRPDSQQGYAPIVRGTARTNARVRVTQNGTLLLETAVAPGAFEIDDLYPTGYGGDLVVTVLEANGSQQSFTVSYASLVQLMRPRVLRYSLAGGDLALNGKRGQGHFFQAALQYGLTNNLTGYAGMILAPGYASGVLGMAFNTPLGAVAIDATVAEAHITPLDVDRGYSVRLSYSKVVPGILTNVSVAAYRHSSGGFWTMEDVLAVREAPDAASPFIGRQRDRLAANVSQSLGGGWGNVYLTGSVMSYWNRAGSRTQVQAGYSNVAPLGKVDLNYGLTYGHQRNDTTGQSEDRVLLSLSLALSRSMDAPRLTASLGRDRLDGHSRPIGQLSLAGTLGNEREFGYNANLNLGQGGNFFGVGAGYRAAFATFSASGGKGDGYGQVSFGASGGLVMHPGGVTLANRLGDTIGLVEAPGAKGAVVGSGSGVRIDGAGHAVVPYLAPYRLNEVSIDPGGLALDIEMKNTAVRVAPQANAVVMLKFETVSGQGVMFTARLPDGSPVPFGASVLDEKQREIGIAGQGGQIYLRGIADGGSLLARWGSSSNDQCRFDYRLPASSRPAEPVIQLAALCRTGVPGTIVAEPEPRITALPV